MRIKQENVTDYCSCNTREQRIKKYSYSQHHQKVTNQDIHTLSSERNIEKNEIMIDITIQKRYDAKKVIRFDRQCCGKTCSKFNLFIAQKSS